MSFDFEKMKSNIIRNFEDNIEEVKLDSLKEFFDKDEEPIFKVKALGLDEINKINNENEKLKQANVFLSYLSNDKETLKEISNKIFGDIEELEPDTVKQINYVFHGLVEPKLNHDEVVFLANTFPVETMQLYREILELTGQGTKVKKKQK